MSAEGEKIPTPASTTQEWVTYVWLDRNGEPRSVQTRRTVPRRYIGDPASVTKPQDYDDLPVEAEVSGYPSRTDALYFAKPFKVYSQSGSTGKILLCHMVDTEGTPLNSAAAKAHADLCQLQEEEGEGYSPTEVLEITQQFYLTTKFVPLSFASNPPAKPGPFGSGVGADLAVARATVTRAVNSLPGANTCVSRIAPLATPSHWGVTFQLRKAADDHDGQGDLLDVASMIMLFRYVLGRACEESNLTPAFIGKLLQDPWPPSLLQFSARTKELSETKLAKRLTAGHESLMRATAATQAATTAEVEKYVWASNAKGPVTVATTADGTAWLIDNRVLSSANPHVAVNEWIKTWRA